MGFKCPHLYTEEIIKEVVDEGVFKKFTKFKLQKEIDKDPLVKWCPKPGCEKFIKAKDTKVT